MKFVIKHDIKGRLRVHADQNRMSFAQADTLEYYLSSNSGITDVKVNDRTCDIIINYSGDRENVINLLKAFSYELADVPEEFISNSARPLNHEYQEKLVNNILIHFTKKLFFPAPLRAVIATIKSTKYIWLALKSLSHGKIEVSVLDGTAIGVSIIRGDFDTAGSVMFLLGIGEILEEWTHKKSVDDLARSMALNVDKVWAVYDNQEILVSTKDIKKNDNIIVRMGNVIPFDGDVVKGDGAVNQASLTGESLPVAKTIGNSVYAGTVLEEGELTIRVREVNGQGKFDKIVTMIEESEKLKSSVEGKAEHLADKLVPYTLAGSALTYLLSRNVTKAVSVLMVDFSCALKLSMPIAVLSAIREAGKNNVTVKGGKYLEAVAQADTIVFDKTGTLTKAKPTVADIYSFNGKDKDELLRIAACMEEHFPHSMAKAVVDAAMERNLEHAEMHSKVEYIVAHGIATTINGKRAVIGSHHFIFEDEKCIIPEGKEDLFNSIPTEYSQLYLAIENVLEGVICIEDPLRPEASEVIKALRNAGFSKIVMMTGDSDKTAKAIAAKVGVDEYYSEVLPEDKASYIENEKANNRKVVMIGDGINDSPALSAANAGVAISDGAQIAREIADITISADNLYEIVTLKNISNLLMKRINKNYRTIVTFNSLLIALGIAGVLPPTTSAMLHNTSTLLISLSSMNNLLPEDSSKH